MHSVCVYTTGRHVWLLLKYYLHAFAGEEEKLLFSSQQKMSCSVWDGLGVCPPKTPMQVYGCSECLASPIGLTKPIKRTLSVTSWRLVVVIWNVI